MYWSWFPWPWIAIWTHLGDNLADFDARFYKQPNDVRIDRLNNTRALFGEKFILIPNLIYGSWEMGFED